MSDQQKTFELILEECITEIIDNETPIEELLRRFSSYRSILRPLLTTAVWLDEEKHIFDSEENYIARSKEKVVEKLKSK